MTHKETMAAKRAYNDALRAEMPPGGRFSGPQFDAFMEGWALVGWNVPCKGHYWRRVGDHDLLALCGVLKPIEYAKGHKMMIFEVGNFDKCIKCRCKRQSANPSAAGAP